MGISEHSQYQMGKQLSEKNTIISGNLDQESNQWMAMKNDPLLCTNMHSYDYTQERDQQYYHVHAFHSPENIEKWFFFPCEHCDILQKHSITYEQNSNDSGNSYSWEHSRWDSQRAWECFQVKWNCLGCVEWISHKHNAFVTVIKEYKTLVSLPLNAICIMLEGDSSEHISGNCWTWWVSLHY